MTKIRFKMLFVLIAAAMIHTSALSRPTLGPPSIKLKSTISNIALMELKAKDEKGRLSFELIEDIHNKSAAHVDIQATQQLAQLLNLNQPYIVGYMAWQTDRFTKEVSPRKGGAVLMNLPGAEPAVIKPSPEMLRILKLDVDQSLKNNSDVLKTISAGLKNKDPQTVNFFVVELVTRTSHHAKTKARKLIKSLLLDPTVAWKSKQFILAYNGLTEKELSSQWFCQFASNTLNHASIELAKTSSDSGLVIQLIEKSHRCQPGKYPIQLSRWVISNHSGVVETAIKIMRSRDLEQTITTVQEALNHSLLQPQNRQTLVNYLKRLHNESQSIKSKN